MPIWIEIEELPEKICVSFKYIVIIFAFIFRFWPLKRINFLFLPTTMVYAKCCWNRCCVLGDNCLLGSPLQLTLNLIIWQFFKVEGTVNKHGDSNQTVLAWKRKRKIEPPPPPKKTSNNNKKRDAIGTFLGDAY